MSYELDGRCSIPDRGKKFFSTRQRQDQLCDQPSLSYSGYERIRRRERATDHTRIVPRSRMAELYLHYVMRFHGVVLNLLRIETGLPTEIDTEHSVFVNCWIKTC
jgi:hypothetical protein